MVKSTRSDHKVKTSKAILDGLAPDGGLYVFTDLPILNLQEMKELSYQETALLVFELLLEDMSHEQLKKVVEESYHEDFFKPSPVTVTHHDNHSYLNLYNGETFAFKDMALSILPKLIQESKKLNDITKPNIVLTATSGDTGSAALSGFSKNKEDYIIVLYPTSGVSAFQEKQMLQFANKHAMVFGVEGNFDDCQTIVKQLFKNVKTNNTNIISANSINIGRIIPQIVYYIYSYFQLIRDNKVELGTEINVVVPTGNFGNIYAAYLATKMGLPINKLIVASNDNNVLHEFFSNGVYNIDRTLYKTISPSMDIIISSNLERYIYDLLNEDSDQLKIFMESLLVNGSNELDAIKRITKFKTDMATETETKAMIQKVLDEDAILIDPHTAVARVVYEKYIDLTKDETYSLLVSTASPYKFIDAMRSALDMPKASNIKTAIVEVEVKTGIPSDIRMKDVLGQTTENKIILKKADAYSEIFKLVGEIDEY